MTELQLLCGDHKPSQHRVPRQEIRLPDYEVIARVAIMEQGRAVRGNTSGLFVGNACRSIELGDQQAGVDQYCHDTDRTWEHRGSHPMLPELTFLLQCRQNVAAGTLRGVELYVVTGVVDVPHAAVRKRSGKLKA